MFPTEHPIVVSPKMGRCSHAKVMMQLFVWGGAAFGLFFHLHDDDLDSGV